MAILSVRHDPVANQVHVDSGYSPYDSLECLVSNEVILVPPGEEIPLERGHERGVPPLRNLEIVILPLLVHLA